MWHCVPGGGYPRCHGYFRSWENGGQRLRRGQYHLPEALPDGAAEAERLYQEARSVVPYGEAAIPLIAIAKP